MPPETERFFSHYDSEMLHHVYLKLRNDSTVCMPLFSSAYSFILVLRTSSPVLVSCESQTHSLSLPPPRPAPRLLNSLNSIHSRSLRGKRTLGVSRSPNAKALLFISVSTLRAQDENSVVYTCLCLEEALKKSNRTS